MNYYNDTKRILSKIDKGDRVRFKGHAYQITEISNHSLEKEYSTLTIDVEHISKAEGTEKHIREIENLRMRSFCKHGGKHPEYTEKGKPYNIHQFFVEPEWREQ